MEKSGQSPAEILESLKQKQPSPIFMGAILSRGNRLLTNQDRFYCLVKDMKDGEFAYPESMKPRVDSITLHDCGHFLDSEEIEAMFVRLSISKKIQWQNVGPRSDCYQITDENLYDFLEEWQDDYEALEFFERCGDYLSLEEIETDDKTP